MILIQKCHFFVGNHRFNEFHLFVGIFIRISFMFFQHQNYSERVREAEAERNAEKQRGGGRVNLNGV